MQPKENEKEIPKIVRLKGKAAEIAMQKSAELGISRRAVVALALFQFAKVAEVKNDG